MGATVVACAVTVGMIAVVLGEPGQMIEELNGEIASPVVQTSIVLPDDLQASLMEGLTMVREGVAEGGIAQMGRYGFRDTARPGVQLASGTKAKINVFMATEKLFIKPSKVLPHFFGHEVTTSSETAGIPYPTLSITEAIAWPDPE